MFFSFLLRRSPSEPHKNTQSIKQKNRNSQEKLKKATLKINGVFLYNFPLFHRDHSALLDVLIFLPHYGLYLGEKISWKVNELQKASIERSNKRDKREPTTRLGIMEELLLRKLEDVLSFNFTPIERFVWMEYLSEAEFDTLDSSFHRLLPKNRVIFNDDTLQTIQSKLYFIGTYQKEPHSKLKAVGALMAHTLLLPTASEPFGRFLSAEQQEFLDTPFSSSIIILKGGYGSGKSTLLIRKVIQLLLEKPHTKIMIITPTLLHTEILREEFISIAEFSAISLNLLAIDFFSLTTANQSIVTTNSFQDASLIVCDDLHLFNKGLLNTLIEHQEDRTLLLSSTNALPEHIAITLKECYRTPYTNQILFSHPDETLSLLLLELKKLRKKAPKSSILIILPNEHLIHDYKNAIDEHFDLNSQILTATFSLQYKSLDSITLSTPQYINALEVPHTYLIHLNPNDPLYPLALSRASESVTIISETIDKP